MSRSGRLVFFLGGRDLEMLEIRRLLEAHAPGRFHDAGLRWGAKASAYVAAIEACLSAGDVPVLVELEDDLGIDPARKVVVDHHGPAAGAEAPTSLERVHALLGLPPESLTRRQRLVAANDRGHIAALVEAGATRAEIAALRAEDRAAQGVTERDEAEAGEAVSRAEVRCGGRLTVVTSPGARVAPVADRLDAALGGPGYRNLLVVSPGEVNFSGEGRVVRALAEAHPEGWWGGSLPERGFWGASPVPDGVAALVERVVGEEGAR